MKLFLIVFILFLLAFTGLACGLIFKRRGLRGGCQQHGNDHDCQCQEANQHTSNDVSSSCCKASHKTH